LDSNILKTIACLTLASVPLACGDDDNDEVGGESTTGGEGTATTSATTTVSTTTPGEESTETLETGPEGESTETTEEGSTTSGTTGTGTTNAETTESTTTETGTGACQVIDITGDLATVEPNLYGWFAQMLLGDPLVNDGLFLQFFSPATGVFDLADPPNDNYLTCDQCIIANEDEELVYYFQSEGSMEVLQDPTTGVLEVTLTGVRLIEVTLDPDTAESTPVPNGGCVDIVDGPVANIVVPDDWTCNPDFYTDNLCDCGCGVVDPVCDDMTVESCDTCDETGSCNAAECPGTIDPANNAVCTA